MAAHPVNALIEVPEPARRKSPNLAAKRGKRTRSEIPEPIAQPWLGELDQIPEPGEELNADELLNRDRRLWNLETYGDRHGKRRVRRVLRFVNKPPKEELGEITPNLEAELKQRRGRGRHRISREEAESLRPFALAIAKSHRRYKRQRNRNTNLQRRQRHNRGDARDINLPASSDHTQWPEVPDVLM